jgi:hypothetical protein
MSDDATEHLPLLGPLTTVTLTAAILGPRKPFAPLKDCGVGIVAARKLGVTAPIGTRTNRQNSPTLAAALPLRFRHPACSASCRGKRC